MQSDKIQENLKRILKNKIARFFACCVHVYICDGKALLLKKTVAIEVGIERIRRSLKFTDH